VINNIFLTILILLTMMNLKDLQKKLSPELLLSTKQMSLVKGGTDPSPVTTDDKRRERPGGGISTL
jgi:hypothetical protein